MATQKPNEPQWAFLVYGEPSIEAVATVKYGSFFNREIAEQTIANLAGNLPSYVYNDEGIKEPISWRVHISRVRDDPARYTAPQSSAEVMAERIITAKEGRGEGVQ